MVTPIYPLNSCKFQIAEGQRPFDLPVQLASLPMPQRLGLRWIVSVGKSVLMGFLLVDPKCVLIQLRQAWLVR